MWFVIELYVSFVRFFFFFFQAEDGIRDRNVTGVQTCALPICKTCLGLEYFCFEGDGLWTTPDAELIALATKELARLGICAEDEVVDGVVVRQQKAYPVYDDSYQANVAVVRDYISTSLPNLHLAGRNGMHKYNHQDHSMMHALP